MTADRRVDEIAQHGLADFHLAREEALDSLFEQLLPEGRVALDPRLNRFPEIPREWHGLVLPVSAASRRDDCGCDCGW